MALAAPTVTGHLRAVRTLLIVLLTLGLLAPKMGAALAALAPGIERVVICAGTEMRVVHLKDGAPMDVALPDLPHCVAAAPLPDPARGLVRWHVLVPSWVLPLPDAPTLAARTPWRGPPPSQGPPAVEA